MPAEKVKDRDNSNVMVSWALLSDGLEVDKLVTDNLAMEVKHTVLCMTGELNKVRLGYSDYFLEEPIRLLDETCMIIESLTLCCMLDVVGVVLSVGLCTLEEVDLNIWTMLPMGGMVLICYFHCCCHSKRVH
jgi:hypothetical protein